jgi:hypothetical protein
MGDIKNGKALRMQLKNVDSTPREIEQAFVVSREQGKDARLRGSQCSSTGLSAFGADVGRFQSWTALARSA